MPSVVSVRVVPFFPVSISMRLVFDDCAGRLCCVVVKTSRVPSGLSCGAPTYCERYTSSMVKARFCAMASPAPSVRSRAAERIIFVDKVFFLIV